MISRAARLRLWERVRHRHTGEKLDAFARLAAADPHNPGAVLLESFAGVSLPGCACGSVARRMDKLGVTGCYREWDSLCKSLLEVAAQAIDKPPEWLIVPRLNGCEISDHRNRYLQVADQILEYALLRADYQPSRWGKVLEIPQPPPLAAPINFPQALVTVAAGELGQDMLAISGPLMEDYANLHGADFIVSTWPGHPDWPMSAKYGIVSAFDNYERIAYVDADVLLRPGCVDLFSACDPGEVGLVNELHYHRLHPEHRIERDYRAMRKRMGFSHRRVDTYFNAGVGVFPKSARWLLEPPTEPLPSYHCAEQDLFNARVQAGAAEGRIKLRMLDRRCNWQHWTDHGFTAAPPDAILHCSGMAWEGEKRLDKMREWAK